MNLTRFEHFLAVARLRHYGRAAEVLGIGQPALSRSIQRLEAELGGALFERAARSIRPTALGEALMPQAEQLIAGMRQARQTAQSVVNGGSRPLSIGATLAGLEEILMPKLARFVTGRGLPRLVIRIDMSHRLVDALLGGEIDVAIGPLGSDLPETISTERLSVSSIGISVGKRHRLARRQSVTIHDIAGEEWILPGELVGVRRALTKIFRDHGLDGPNVRVEMDQPGPTILDLVANTHLLSLHAGAAMPHPGVAVLKLESGTLKRELLLAWRRSWPKPKSVDRLLADLRSPRRSEGRLRAG